MVARFLVRVPWSGGDVHWARASAVVFGAAVLTISWVNTRIPTEWLPGAGAQVLLLGAGAVAAFHAFGAAWRPSPRRIGVAFGGGTAAMFLVLVAWFLPAFRDAQPNAPLTADIVRERAYRPDAAVVACSDPVRVQRDLLFDARVVVQERCDLWALAASSHPFLLVLGPEEARSLARLPQVREIATYRGLPATALTFGGLVAGVEPQPLALVANFDTDDPVAEVKRKKDRKRALRDGEP